MKFFIKLIKKIYRLLFENLKKKIYFLLVNCILNNYFVMKLTEMSKLNKNMHITNECIKIINFSHIFKVQVYV